MVRRRVGERGNRQRADESPAPNVTASTAATGGCSLLAMPYPLPAQSKRGTELAHDFANPGHDRTGMPRGPTKCKAEDAA